MHIAEGYLPPVHAALWTLAAAPFVGVSLRAVRRRLAAGPRQRMLLGAAGAFCFALSALKLPSVAGSSSHPTGAGLGAALFGPSVMPLLGTVVLLFQALLLAHGGLTTLGANVLSMAVAGPWVAWITFRLALRAFGSLPVAAFLAGAAGDLATYAMTAFQLALAFPDPVSGTAGAFLKFASVFGLAQLPLAGVEGVLTAMAMRSLCGREGLPVPLLPEARA